MILEVNGMKDLDEDARIMVEKNIDIVIKEPKKYEEAFRSILKVQGIEPNLETILSFIIGLLAGMADGIYVFKYERTTNADEKKELMELLNRRAFEMRQAFVSIRIE